ncbi:MAG: cytochrome C oxidase subunit I [Rubrivivax sp. SCN 71-131]|jgi:cytochrome c oxidase assembly protein subunit 15|nr:MAG: cytochrome C oxidase subunit I [Rubrivivax sp. SCN 71-131]
MQVSPSLYDLTPAAQLMLVGAVVALLPLAWILVRHRGGAGGERWQMLARLLLFLTFDLVLFGAFTRLTDSGLGCPDWPGCYGNASPLGARHEILAAETAMPSGPVTHGKAWIEMIHRYAATSIGALITFMMIAAWWQRRRDPHSALSPAWASAVFVWVCVQGAFGALTVTLKLYPAIVTLHLLGGYLGLVLITVLARDRRQPAIAVSTGLRSAAWAMLALLFLQSALGGWVSTNYAVLACSEFPRCQGSWWPPMDFRHGFTVLRDLGATAAGDLLPFAALTAIHYVHRLGAYLVLACMLVLAWALRRSDEPTLRGYGLALAALAAWQLASGLSNVVLGWPILAALSHTGGAGAAIVCVTALLTRTRGERGAGASVAFRPGAAAGPAAAPR